MRYIILLATLFVFSATTEAQVPINSLVGSYEFVSATMGLSKEESEIMGIETLHLPAYPDFVTVTSKLGNVCNFSGTGNLEIVSSNRFSLKLDVVIKCDDDAEETLSIEDMSGTYIQEEKVLVFIPDTGVPESKKKNGLFEYSVHKETDGVYIDLIETMSIMSRGPNLITFRRVN